MSPSPTSTIPSRPILLNLALALAAVAVLALLVRTTGQIEINEGLGYDGSDYGSMVERGFSEGTPNTRVRPAIIVLAWLPYHFTGDVIRSFRILNYAFAFIGAYLIAMLYDRYGPGRTFEKAYLIVSLAVCIATARMFAYYPVLVDLGGYVVLTAAVYAVVSASRPVAAVAVCLAVLTREFGFVAGLFGIHRDIRRGGGIGRALLTYLPSLVVFFVLRHFALPGAQSTQVTSLPRLISNLELWRDPLFVAFFVYFFVTLFGGISMILFARAGDCLRFLREEPEWATFALPIVALAVAGSADTWRYLAFVLPAAVVLFARISVEWSLRERAWLCSLAAVGTWYTQRPFQHVDLKSYFLDWFPYDMFLQDIPGATRADLWPAWGWKFVFTAGLLWLLSVAHFRRKNA